MREIIEELQSSFDELIRRSVEMTKAVAADDLFRKPAQFEGSYEMFSIGEFMLRSTGAIEQAFAGITTRLWDDPFEWTLPEYMASPERILDYLDEVSETARRGFTFLKDDDELKRQLPAPRELKTILQILLSAIERAAHFQGRAAAACQLVSGKRPAAVPKDM
jgi:hypothetical protein